MTVKDAPIRVTHVINGLGMGGAEMSLLRLIGGLSRRFDFSVVTLTGADTLLGDLQSQGVQIDQLDMHGPVSAARQLRSLGAILAQRRPDVIHTWLYQSDFIASIANMLTERCPVIWSLRSSDTGGAMKRLPKLLLRSCAYMSHHLPAAIVCGSNAAMNFHAKQGYDVSRMRVIPNGIDFDAVKRTDRLQARAHFGLPSDKVLVGRIARFHPHKDVPAFIDMAERLLYRASDVDFVLCGEGCDWSNEELSKRISATGYPDRFHLLGMRRDVERLFSGLDVTCSSSITEGFPNVVAESLAYGVPVVGTDVGDTRVIVGRGERVVPPGDADAMAVSLEAVLRLAPEQLTILACEDTERVKQRFSLDRTCSEHAELYASVACRG